MIRAWLKKGFTITELVVTITAIALLVAGVYVAYGGWRRNVLITEIKSDLVSAASAMESYKNFNSGYPASIPTTFTPTSGVTLSVYASSASAYCINGTATSDSSLKYYIKQNNTSASDGSCSGNTQVVPAVPTGLTATAQSMSSVNVSWSAVSGATSYRIQRSTDASFASSVVTSVSSSTSLVSGSLMAGTKYYYRVSAFNDAGASNYSANVSATTQSGCSGANAYGTYPNCYAYDSYPVGTSLSGYFTSAPSGYLIEDGSAVSRTTYAALFAVIGTTYGAGDGSTTFNLPDSRGRVTVNLNPSDTQFNTMGEKYGEKVHQLTIDEMPSHTHSIYLGATDDFNWDGYKFTTYPQYPPADGPGQYLAGQYTGTTGGNATHNIIQPSIVKLSVIKYTVPPINSDIVTAGTSIDGYWQSIPAGYMVEDGSAVSRTTYSDLFSVIGTTYGAGDGSTTFNLPDSRGRTGVNLLASDGDFSYVGEKYGEKNHTVTISEMARHAHLIYISYVDDLNWSGYSLSGQYPSADSGYQCNTGQVSAPTGGGSAYNVIQPSITKKTLIKVSSTADASAINKAPVGASISGYWGSVPNGYLSEDGSAVSRTTYAALFAVIGTTYGAGDGSTTFNLPDSRGRVSVSKNSSDSEFNVVGKKYGEKKHQLTVAELPSHSHGLYIGTVDDQNWAGYTLTNPIQYPPADAGGLYNQGQVTAPTGGDSPHNIEQPSIVRLYAIKY